MRFCIIYTIFALSACFHAVAGRTRELKSTLDIIGTDSSTYGTLSSQDFPSPSSDSVRPSGSHPLGRTLKGAGGRIAYGQQATSTQFPYVIYFDSDGGTCSGSVIAPRVILTAAHCVWDSETNGFVDKTNSRIYFNRGFVDYDYGTDAGEIKGFYVPSQYEAGGSSNLGDVGLVELVDPIPDSIKPVGLAGATTKMPAGTTLTVAGWGEMDNGKMADHLMFTTGKVMDTTKCEALHSDLFDYELDADHFCIAVPQKTMQTTCGGDSGGPYLLLQPGQGPVQVGATSFGPSGDCGSKMAVDVPVSIKYWRSWIEDTLSMNNMRGAQAPVKVNVPVYNQCYKGGTVVSTKTTATYGRCLQSCRSAANAGCMAWTWQKGGLCTLFTTKGTVVKSKDCTSGYFK
jgi:secreted trypsin-like serine protease